MKLVHYTKRAWVSDLLDNDARSQLRPDTMEELENGMRDRGAFFVDSVRIPGSESVYRSSRGSLENIRDWSPPGIQIDGLQQTTLSRIVFSHKQIQPAQPRQRDIAEELESGNMQRLDHRSKQFSAFRWMVAACRWHGFADAGRQLYRMGDPFGQAVSTPFHPCDLPPTAHH